MLRKKKVLLIIACLSAFAFSYAQTGQTEKKLKVKELDCHLCGTYAEFTISKSGDNINVSERGLKSTGVKGCDNCNVSGKITFTGGAEASFVPHGVTNSATGMRNISTVIALPPIGGAVKTTTLNADGSFSFTGLPKGTYQLSLGDAANIIVKGWKVGGE